MGIMKKCIIPAACLWAALSSFSLSAQQKDWAQFGRYAEANKELNMRPKVVFMGNSITDHWWPADSLFFKDNQYACRGISGQTTAEMLVRFRADVINLKPQAVAILAGINDIAENNGVIALPNVFGNIVSMVELAEANHIRVILCSVLPAWDFPWRPGLEPADKVIRLNEMIRKYAEENHIPYVDYHGALKDNRNGLPKKYSQDGVHPTLEGYKVMENLVGEAIRQVLK